MKAFAAFVVDKKKYVLVLYVLLIAAGIVGLFYTNVNYDMSKYLPSDSSVKEGMAVMDEEFGSLSSITVMFTGLDESERQTVRQALAQVENVKSVAYTAGDDAYDRGENAKYVLTIGAGTYTDEAREVLRTLRTQFSDYDVSYSGAVADNDLLITTLTEWDNIHTTTGKKILYVFTFPLFMLTYIPIAIAAIFRRVEWAPIEHTVTTTIDNVKDVKKE